MSAASIPLVPRRPHGGGRPHQVAPGASAHNAHFYDRSEQLHEVVVEYRADGVAAGQVVVVIATRDHWRAFVAGLQQRGFDTDALISRRELVVLDVRDTLAGFVAGPMPDTEMFDATVGDVFRALVGHSWEGAIRAYREMVDLLCREGKPTAAIGLEKLWNKLGKELPISLLCACSDGGSIKALGGDVFSHICAEHQLVEQLVA